MEAHRVGGPDPTTFPGEGHWAVAAADHQPGTGSSCRTLPVAGPAVPGRKSHVINTFI